MIADTVFLKGGGVLRVKLIELLVDLAGLACNRREYKGRMKFRHGFLDVNLFTDPLRQSAPPVDEEGHVSAQMLRHLSQFPLADIQVIESVESKEHRRSIGRSATESPAKRYSFRDARLHWQGMGNGLLHELVRSYGEVGCKGPRKVILAWSLFVPIGCESRDTSRGQRHQLQLVEHIDIEHPRTDRVHSVGLYLAHRQRQIQLRRSMKKQSLGHLQRILSIEGQRAYHLWSMLWQPRLPEEYRTFGEREIAERISARREELGSRLLILGHHYQQDETIRHADLCGDSLRLSQLAAEESKRRGTEFIVFCGVHFMAETAEVLTDDAVQVILPDLSAGCSMADMAQWDDVVDCWEGLREILGDEPIVPITYVNSSAAVKAFVGMHGGACCTSSNAGQVFDWARRQHSDARILFMPDQHLGRNTAHARGILTEVDAQETGEMPGTAVWNPRKRDGGLPSARYRNAEVVLWAGHCSVHRLFRPEHVTQAREDDPDVRVIVHPECAQEVVDLCDLAGSTEYIIRTIEEAAPETSWAVGTEVHLVSRLARAAAERGVKVRILSDCQCLCTTMYRIDPAHLLFVLDNLAAGKVINRIEVHPDAQHHAREALTRMLSHVQPTPVAVKS